MRVSPERQTLILAGELVPRRIGREAIGAQLTPFSRNVISTKPADRGNSYSAANAYARTQELSDGRLRSVIIDTYA